MQAIISDLHSNMEALDAVFEDIEEQGATEIACLGDIVGYGPDPEPCIDIVEERCRFCISGNHDYAVLTRAEGFNPLAEEAVDPVLEKARLPVPRLAVTVAFVVALEEQVAQDEESHRLPVGDLTHGAV